MDGRGDGVACGVECGGRGGRDILRSDPDVYVGDEKLGVVGGGGSSVAVCCGGAIGGGGRLAGEGGEEGVGGEVCGEEEKRCACGGMVEDRGGGVEGGGGLGLVGGEGGVGGRGWCFVNDFHGCEGLEGLWLVGMGVGMVVEMFGRD